ncbi:MAG: hypothetical protein ACYDH5_05635 [Acidimicrobiales bacterium]
MPLNVWPNYVMEALLVVAFVAALVARYPRHEEPAHEGHAVPGSRA